VLKCYPYARHVTSGGSGVSDNYLDEQLLPKHMCSCSCAEGRVRAPRIECKNRARATTFPMLVILRNVLSSALLDVHGFIWVRLC